NNKVLVGVSATVAIITFFHKSLSTIFKKTQLFIKTKLKLKSVLLPSRKAYMDALNSCLNMNKDTYRAIIVGPLFLSPPWVFDRRNRESSTKSYDDKLFNFLLSKSNSRTHDIRIILRNQNRYVEKIDKLVLPDEREEFKKCVLRNIDSLWGSSLERGPDLVCSDVGHFRIDVIFDKAMISAARLSKERPVNGGYISYDSVEINQQRHVFDQVFDELSRGNGSEVEELKRYIKNLWTE
ncbi:hypothetical protein L1D59_23925, partial [Pseudoalteromonas piscicida]|uniref:hypothetical protein n=1 Tax=Pseudoalteromonas piscicida TaxID=43662 RepID=UPI001EFD1220